MTKTELRDLLRQGWTLDKLFKWTEGQECTIYKADEFALGDEVIYIPDLDLNEIPNDVELNIDNSMNEDNPGWPNMTSEEQIRVVLSYCYTGQDFVDECNGDEALAYRLFWYCDWQNPGSAFPEVDYDDDEDKASAKEAYEKAKKEGRVHGKDQ